MQRLVVIYALVFIVSTGLVCGIRPQLHKRAVFLDYRYKVVDTVEPVDIVQSPVPQPSAEPQNVQQTVAAPKAEPVKVDIKPSPSKVQQIKTTSVQTPVVKQTEKVTTKPMVQQTVKPAPQQQPATVVQPVKPTVAVQEQPKAVTQPVLTVQQETVLWNKWRSNIQNKIMDTVNMPTVPQGTVFKFTFNVDKNGRITNIKSWSVDPKYNPYAIQYVTPAIRSLQGKSILSFPSGTNRESTVVEGNFRISNKSGYSTANNYDDVETIKH